MKHSMTRRRFLAGTSSAVALLHGLGYAQDASTGAAQTPQPLKLLILGGTGFLGPHIVESAIARGHTMTLFNRGKTNPHLFPDLEKLKGDRNGDLKALEGREWDGVIDTSAYIPRVVHLSAGLLKEKVKHYALISTVSVYAKHAEEDVDETSEVGKLEDETTEKVTNETYGPLKALCEQAAEEEMPGRVANIRPGLIVGPGDPTDRFTYWPARVARGGEVLAPNSPADKISFIDVRDLAEWTVQTIENRTAGVFNADGPKDPLPIGELLESCKKVSKSDAVFRYGETSFLSEHKVQPWAHMPAWFPAPEDGEMPVVSNDRAVEAGLTFRGIDDTVRATLEWHQKRPEDYRLRAGISPEREAEVIRAWHEAQASSEE
ncbi:MAG: NAD-dependent epimerase/dehydratase family protein [Planctomycetota bacterium]